MKILSIGSDKQAFTKDSALAKRLVKHGGLVDELHVVVYTTEGDGITESVELSHNVKVYPTRSSNRFVALADAYHLSNAIFKDRNFTSNNSVITTQDPFETGFIGMLLSLANNASLHVQIHTDLYSPHFIFSSPLNLVRSIISMAVLPYSDRVRVVSRRVSSRTIFRLVVDEQKVDVVPIFVAPDVSSQSAERAHGANKVILVVSRLEPEKDVALAIDVFAKVKKEIPDSVLVIVGSGRLENDLKRKVRQAGLDSSVHFKGKQEEVRSFYASSDLLLVTSKFEGFGMVYLEASFMGIPVVSTDVGIVGDILVPGEGVLRAPVGNSRVLAFNAVKVLNDNALAQKLPQHALQSIKTACITNEQEYLEEYKNSWLACLQNDHSK